MHALTVSAMLPICRNWQNAYIIFLSKGLNRLRGQAAVVATREYPASIEGSMEVISRKLFVRLRPVRILLG